ncbi:MAG TPA: agglutinin biogenesis protein MshI [Burkholderiales bacterium]|jgi:MSHA biogenesis protein MshI|nr:agglutinin biogenesis protein MshI [Burkholderiales bacterium]
MLGRKRSSGLTAVHLQSDRVDVARIARTGLRPRVELCTSFPNRGNELETLSQARKRLHLDRHRCATLLPSTDYRLQLLEAPNVPEPEIKAATRWRLKDALDYPVDAATVDVFFVPSDPAAPTRARLLYAVAASNERIGACMNLFAQARLPLAVIDIPEMAQRNLAALFEVERRALALLSFTEQRGLLTFTCGGELYVARTIETGLAAMAAAQGDLRAQLFERIVLEVQRSLDHFERQFSALPVARLLLAPMPEEVGLHAHLAQNLYVPVEVARLEAVLDLQEVPDLAVPENQSRSFLALGAALREEALQ